MLLPILYVNELFNKFGLGLVFKISQKSWNHWNSVIWNHWIYPMGVNPMIWNHWIYPMGVNPMIWNHWNSMIWNHWIYPHGSKSNDLKWLDLPHGSKFNDLKSLNLVPWDIVNDFKSFSILYFYQWKHWKIFDLGLILWSSTLKKWMAITFHRGKLPLIILFFMVYNGSLSTILECTLLHRAFKILRDILLEKVMASTVF